MQGRRIARPDREAREDRPFGSIVRQDHRPQPLGSIEPGELRSFGRDDRDSAVHGHRLVVGARVDQHHRAFGGVRDRVRDRGVVTGNGERLAGVDHSILVVVEAQIPKVALVGHAVLVAVE